jgi:hypothetical protein
LLETVASSTQEPGGNARDNLARSDVARHNRSGTYYCALADRDPTHNDRTASERGTFAHSRFDHLPIGWSSKGPVNIGCVRLQIVNEYHPVTDENLIFDHHALAQETVRRDLAPLADHHPLLDLDKGANSRFVAYPTGIDIDQVGLEDPDVTTQFRINDRH